MSRRARIAAAGVVAAGLAAVAPARSADNIGVERLATCQDSWFEWKQGNAPQLQQFARAFQTAFERKAGDGFLVPRSSESVAGLPIARVFPESVGMGVGFSVIVNAGFDATKSAVERKSGKPFRKCETSDNMRTCAVQIGDKKTLMLMAEDPPTTTETLVGCYYFYEK